MIQIKEENNELLLKINNLLKAEERKHGFISGCEHCNKLIDFTISDIVKDSDKKNDTEFDEMLKKLGMLLYNGVIGTRIAMSISNKAHE